LADSQRIEDLRRRVQKDPASIAFAQLAEELRRAGGFEEAVNVCRAGLELHPGYLSARVTLGRALLELNDLDTALAELEHVLKSAPENLAAIRGLAEIHHRQGNLTLALAQYRAALALARNDPELQQTVDELARQIEPPAPPASADGLSFEQMQNELLQNLEPPPPVKPAAPAVSVSAPVSASDVEPVERESSMATETETATDTETATETATETGAATETAAAFWWSPPPSEPSPEPMAVDVAPPAEIEDTVVETAEQDQARRTIGALEQYLDAIHVARAQPRP
jgi:tetratricopeptide (TPR) repeat protein